MPPQLPRDSVIRKTNSYDKTKIDSFKKNSSNGDENSNGYYA